MFGVPIAAVGCTFAGGVTAPSRDSVNRSKLSTDAAAALPDTDGPLDAEEGAVCDGAGRVTYVVRVAGDAASWAETAARTDFDAIALDYDAVLDGDTVTPLRPLDKQVKVYNFSPYRWEAAYKEDVQ